MYKILSLSDVVVDTIYNPQIRERYAGVDLVLGCGDLPYSYLEFVVSCLDKPLYFVHGNHTQEVELSESGERRYPHGANNIHARFINHMGLLLAGIEGCIRYRPGLYQYTQGEMWWYVFQLIPGMLWNRLVHGRYLDVFISHSPPWGVHDQPDLPHQGVKAFRWLDLLFRPAYHFHGHIHLYRQDIPRETRLGGTQVINTFGYRLSEVEPRRNLSSRHYREA